MNISEIPDIIIAVIATCAFILSLFNFFIDRHDKKIRIKLKLKLVTYNLTDESWKKVFSIEVINKGLATIFFQDVHCLVIKSKVRLDADIISGMGDENQNQLLPHENSVFITSTPLNWGYLTDHQPTEDLKIRAFIRDGLGTRYKSNLIIIRERDLYSK